MLEGWRGKSRGLVNKRQASFRSQDPESEGMKERWRDYQYWSPGVDVEATDAVSTGHYPNQ